MRYLRPILIHAVLKFVAPLLIVFFVYDFTVCTGITFDDPYTPLDIRQVRGDGRIRLVPLDSFPTSTLHARATYYKKKYGLGIEIASPIEMPSAATDLFRGQLISDAVVDVLQAHHPQPSTERLIVIGLVQADMYIPKYNWRYAISYRKADRYAVVSMARLNRGCLGMIPVSQERVDTRIRKMVTKNIEILYFQLPMSDDPRSVLYRNIGGTQEFDRMSEDF